MTEQYKRGWTDPRTMSTAELFADYVATKAQVDKPWAGLTQIDVDSWDLPDRPTVFEFAQFIEAKLKEKNNG